MEALESQLPTLSCGSRLFSACVQKAAPATRYMQAAARFPIGSVRVAHFSRVGSAIKSLLMPAVRCFQLPCF